VDWIAVEGEKTLNLLLILIQWAAGQDSRQFTFAIYPPDQAYLIASGLPTSSQLPALASLWQRVKGEGM